VSYLVAAYAIAIGGVVGYARWLARTRQRLARELADRSAANRG